MQKPLTNAEIDSLLDKPKGALNNAKKLNKIRGYIKNLYQDQDPFGSISVIRRVYRIGDLLESIGDSIQKTIKKQVDPKSGETGVSDGVTHVDEWTPEQREALSILEGSPMIFYRANDYFTGIFRGIVRAPGLVTPYKDSLSIFLNNSNQYSNSGSWMSGCQVDRLPLQGFKSYKLSPTEIESYRIQL